LPLNLAIFTRFLWKLGHFFSKENDFPSKFGRFPSKENDFASKIFHFPSKLGARLRSLFIFLGSLVISFRRKMIFLRSLFVSLQRKMTFLRILSVFLPRLFSSLRRMAALESPGCRTEIFAGTGKFLPGGKVLTARPFEFCAGGKPRSPAGFPAALLKTYLDARARLTAEDVGENADGGFGQLRL
jgi:hypothetical protein